MAPALFPVPWPLGIVPSLNTPFTEAGRVDIAAAADTVRHLAATGCAGILALAVAGEGESLTAPERDRLLAAVSRAARGLEGPFPVIASLGARPDRAERAVAAGADILLYQAPTGAGRAALADDLGRVARAGRPVMLQDFDPEGPGMAVDDILALAREVPALRYLKIETRPSGPKQSAILAAGEGRLHVSGGWAVAEMPDALQRGIHAFIPTEMEEIYVAVHRAFHAGDRARAEALFVRIAPVLAFCNRDVATSIRFLKRMRRRRGLFRTERCRADLPEFDAVTMAEADRLIDVALAAVAESRAEDPSLSRPRGSAR